MNVFDAEPCGSISFNVGFVSINTSLYPEGGGLWPVSNKLCEYDPRREMFPGAEKIVWKNK